MYDYIIIGAGIAGLYAAYNLKKTHPHSTFLLLEANRKQYIGGRAHQEPFADHLVTTGAGIGRKAKDKYLIKLLDELRVDYHEFKVKTSYTFDPLDVKTIMTELRHHFEKNHRPRCTFKEFTLPLLGAETYKHFLLSAGYTDYENDGVEEVLYMYGFEDNVCCWTAFSVPWNELTKKLVEHIGILNIKTNSLVTRIEEANEIVSVHVSDHLYQCRKLIMATTIASLRTLLKKPIYNEIEAQPFFRIYATVAKKYIEIMKANIKGTTIVPNELQKIIPMDSDRGLYMIAYSDNKNASKIKQSMKPSIVSEDKSYNLDKMNYIDNKEYITNLIKQALGIPDLKLNKIVGFYREAGTHYYKPLNNIYRNRTEFIKQAQRPSKNIFVIGEVVSENQGWVNSALSTYHKIKNFL
jgi:NAD(P)-binding Rossmann-like domain